MFQLVISSPCCPIRMFVKKLMNMAYSLTQMQCKSDANPIDQHLGEFCTDSRMHAGQTLPQDTDAFASSLQVASAGFDSALSPSMHISEPGFTHPLNTNSVQQLGNDFGYIRLGEFKLYTGSPVIWQSVPDKIQAHKLVRANGVLSFLGARESQSRVI